MILDIFGGGGSGKTTLKSALLKMGVIFAGFVPYTTRPKRPEEIEGVHYHFVSVEAYLNNSSLLLKREADGMLYGVDRNDLMPRTDGKVLVTTFDVEGIRTLEKMGKTVRVAYLNISEDERRRRMLSRGDDPAAIERRILIDRDRAQNLEFNSPVLEILGGDLNEIVERVQEFIAG